MMSLGFNPHSLIPLPMPQTTVSVASIHTLFNSVLLIKPSSYSVRCYISALASTRTWHWPGVWPSLDMWPS